MRSPHMSTSAPAKAPTPEQPGSGAASGALDRYFRITERGSTLSREIRGGLATFFAMAYIIVLNPIILGSAKDMYGNQLDNGQLVTATALTAAFTTLLNLRHRTLMPRLAAWSRSRSSSSWSIRRLSASVPMRMSVAAPHGAARGISCIDHSFG
ncbi:hypothetical protein STENM223S_08615 [Streptomyces tendae]